MVPDTQSEPPLEQSEAPEFWDLLKSLWLSSLLGCDCDLAMGGEVFSPNRAALAPPTAPGATTCWVCVPLPFPGLGSAPGNVPAVSPPVRSGICPTDAEIQISIHEGAARSVSKVGRVWGCFQRCAANLNV